MTSVKNPASPRPTCSPTRLARALHAALPGLLLCGGAIAQTDTPPPPAEATTLPAVTVKGTQKPETATGPVSGYAAKRSATATKTDTPLIEVPQSISVIGRHEMEARGAQDVNEIVRYTTGLSVGQYGYDNRGWEDITLRGFSTFSSTFRDGLRMPNFDQTLPVTEPYGLERVEVLRGPASVTFGQGDAGGVIHRVSKMPTGERIREVEVQLGTYDRRQVGIDLGDSIDGTPLSYRVVGLVLDANDEYKYSDGHELNRKRRYLAPSLRIQPTASTSLTLLGEVLQNRAPEDAYYVIYDGFDPEVRVGDYSASWLNQDQNSIGYRFESQLNDQWTLRQNFRYTHIKMSRSVVYLNGDTNPDGTLGRYTRTWNDPQTQLALDTSLQGQFTTGSAEHTVLLGIDAFRQKGRASRFQDDAPGLDVSAPVYGQFIPQPQTPFRDFTQVTKQLGLYAQDQIKLDQRWVITLGGRQDWVRQSLDDRLTPADSGEQRDDAFSARGGLTYLAGNGWAPYVSYAESFLPTSGRDGSTGSSYKPSRGKQVEAGVKYEPQGSELLLTAALYDLRKTNVVSFDPITFDSRQIGKQRSRGVELEAKGRLLRNMQGTASYTWLDSRITQSANPAEIDKRPPGAPKQLASVWLDYDVGSRLGVGLGVRYVGGSANNEVNDFSTPSYTLVDAAVHQSWGDWQVALNVSNLFDRTYTASCYTVECYRGTGRTAVVTAKYRF